eukprot:SAG11_NODE_30617_length_299_cov_0.780000_1_plen_59_part_00
MSMILYDMSMIFLEIPRQKHLHFDRFVSCNCFLVRVEVADEVSYSLVSLCRIRAIIVT